MGTGGLSSVMADYVERLTPAQKAASAFFEHFWDNRGWGFGLSIITRRDDLPAVPGRFGWDGGYGPSAYPDPKEDMVGILMTQRVWDSPRAPDILPVGACFRVQPAAARRPLTKDAEPGLRPKAFSVGRRSVSPPRAALTDQAASLNRIVS
jgi:CubicO group peptidase (beta-lactamase class C family)